MRIIFEGMQGCGKNKLIDTLCANSWLFRKHSIVCDHGPSSDVAQANVTYDDAKMYVALKSLELQTSKDTIFNRSFIGNTVWAKLFGSYDATHLIRSIQYPEDLKVIVLVARPEVVLKCGEKLAITDVDDLIDMYTAYKELATILKRELHIDTLFLDVSNFESSEVYNEVYRFLNKHNFSNYTFTRNRLLDTKKDNSPQHLRTINNFCFRFEPYFEFEVVLEPGCMNVGFVDSVYTELIKELLDNKYSLEAVTYFLGHEDGLEYAMSMIHDEKFNITVNMSSVDILKLPTIFNCFKALYDKMFLRLKKECPGLRVGSIYMNANVIYRSDV
jgi:hypothetical protein